MIFTFDWEIWHIFLNVAFLHNILRALQTVAPPVCKFDVASFEHSVGVDSHYD